MKQVFSAAGYEKMVLRINSWMVEQGYDAFAEVVEVTPHRYELKILADDGVPRTREVDGLIEFFVGMERGDVEKGGCRKTRSQE